MQKETNEPQKIYLKDYQAPEFMVDQVELFFDLNEDFCRVKTSQKIRRVPGSHATEIWLDGVNLELESVHLNGELLPASRYEVRADGLRIRDLPVAFGLETIVKNRPHENTSLEGLYKSNGMFTTQCEAQGFRKITYFLDRPDVMSSFTVTIEADQKKYPVLLSNGDRIDDKTFNNGRHQVTWRDPFKKPCYLFALVAGDLGCIRDLFTTQSGRKVNLEIYAAHGQQDRCHFAMASLKKSMQWDEQRFGREYDLSTYMIVAVDDFNAGAMENKGLNIFNSRLVLADAKTATDEIYFAIESVIAHEYFHNWTGNRVTLRDWFHLSLKEGLTVFRDQEFSMDLHSRPMIRIDTVTDLRDSQFAEDAGPHAHPIRPELCLAVDNFFTPTIYEKGAEVIRMMQTIVGRPGFRKGMDLYFERHDGQAVIIEDFASAIGEPNQQDWSQFKLWYSQAGTPVVSIKEDFDAKTLNYRLELSQSCPPSPEQQKKEPFHIPLVIGLLNDLGQDIEVQGPKVLKNSEGQSLIYLKQAKEVFEFTVPSRPVLSLNRGFSAPIHLDWKASEQDLLFLLAHDSDAYNRWEAAQKLMINDLLRMIRAHASGAHKGEALRVSPSLIEAFGLALDDSRLDLNLKAKLLALPSDSYLAQLTDTFTAESFDIARKSWQKAFAQAHEKTLLKVYQFYHGKNDESLHHTHMAERRLKNAALAYLALLPNYSDLVWTQLQSAAHMTDYQGAFMMCADMESPRRDQAIEHFFERWRGDSLTMNNWFSMQALSKHSATAARSKELWAHPDFNSKNPNRVYSLLGRFGDNLVRFHENSGTHYDWLADRIVELDRINPQVATRIAGAFDLCTKTPPAARAKARTALDGIVNQGLSKNTFEILSRTLESLGPVS